MEKANKPKTLEEIRRFFSRESMHKVLKSVLSYIVKGKKVNFSLNIGGGSFMSAKGITVGLPELFFKETFEVMYLALVTLAGHEGQHRLSTDLQLFIDTIDKESERLASKGMHKGFARKFVHSVLNIVEDGRIENILVNRLPGFIPKVQFLNMYFWNRGEVTSDTHEFHGLTSTMLSLSVLGIYPKNYNKTFKGTRLDKEIDKIKPLIEQGVKDITSEDCFNTCKEIIKVIEPYLFELYEEIKNNQEEMQQQEQNLEDYQDDLSDCEETEFNDSQGRSSHIEMPSNEEEHKEEDKEDSGDASGKDNEEEDEETEEKGSSKSPTEEDSESDDETSGAESTEKEEESKEKDGDDSEKNSKSKDSESEDKEESKADEDEEAKESSDDKEGEKSSDKEKSEQETNDLSEGIDTNATEEDSDALAQELINEKMKEIFEDLKIEADEKFKEVDTDERIREKSNQGDNYNLTLEEINELKKKHGGYGFQEISNDFPLTHSLPNEIKVPAKKFRKEIEKIFKNRSMMNINGQNKGVLNVNDLYRVGVSDYNVFTIEGNKSLSDYVVYILRDGSGSMQGEKEIASAYALSIIEEGIRDIVPFKTSTFCANRYVTHYTVRDWNDKSKSNYAFNYLHHRGVEGGNEDGYSIRVATKELLKRPERDKVLIVLSDGLPSNIADTKEAIKEARKQKIHLVGIMFGSQSFRENNFDRYREMYEKNIIATAPNNIPDRLTKVLKQILSR